MMIQAAEMKKIKTTSVLMIVVLILMVAYYLILNKDKYKQNVQNNIIASITDSSPHRIQSSLFGLDTNVSAAFLTGKFNPAKDPEFDLIDPEFTNRTEMYLLKDTYKAFMKMYYAAQKDGIKLIIISATRNFSYQKGIWEQKWNGSKLVDGKNLAITVKDPFKRAETILKYSSMPGTSRHHWGTDVDLNSMDVKYFETPPGNKIYDWLVKNGNKYGFCQPFNSKEAREKGYEEEKWHWSYVPLSAIFLRAYLNKVDYSYISGFAGCETAAKVDVIKNYVIALNPDCK
jgi:zinc D-Ala-D-Ala carboxypeptidase